MLKCVLSTVSCIFIEVSKIFSNCRPHTYGCGHSSVHSVHSAFCILGSLSICFVLLLILILLLCSIPPPHPHPIPNPYAILIPMLGFVLLFCVVNWSSACLAAISVVRRVFMPLFWLRLGLDFVSDNLLPDLCQKQKKKKEGKSRNKEERKIVRSRRNRKGKGYVVCPERYAGLPIAGPRKANANTFASHPITSSICYYFGSLWFWSLLWPGDAVVVTTLLCPLFMGCSLASNLLRPSNSECRIPIPVRAQQWPQMKNPLRLIVSPVTWN